jgi:Cof subfamily protein (haloacid dehalogenase superfamily)
MRHINLVALDLDGTLLRSQSELSKLVIHAVHEVKARGVKVVLASARPPRSVREVYEHLKLDTWQINYNGALIYDPVARRNVKHQPIDPALVRRIIRVARKVDPQALVSLEILDKWYTDHFDESLPTETSRRFEPDFIGPLDAFLRVPVTKLMLLAPPQRMKKIGEVVERKFAGKVNLMVSDEHLLQVAHRDVDKGAALRFVCEHYGIAPANVMAVGDAPNDLPMFAYAGLSVAMENGWPAVRQAADVIAPPNDRDGIVNVLHRFILSDTKKRAADRAATR